jgi:hypothetical protein
MSKINLDLMTVVDTKNLPVPTQLALQWVFNLLLVGLAAAPLYLSLSIDKPNRADEEYISTEVKCLTKKQCIDLKIALQKFEQDTGVKPQFASSNGPYHAVPIVGSFTKDWFTQDTKRLKAWIQTYSSNYPERLKFLNYYGSIDDFEGDYYNSKTLINSEATLGSFFTIHEIGHAFTPLQTRDQQLRAMEYFWGPGLVNLTLTADRLTTIEGIRDYALNGVTKASLNITLRDLAKVSPSKRIQFLRDRDVDYPEISSVPMELFAKTFTETNPTKSQELKLRQIVLLSNGNKTYLTDEFLAITCVLHNPDQDFDSNKFERTIAKYLATSKKPKISNKLLQYYKEAVKMKLITPKP